MLSYLLRAIAHLRRHGDQLHHDAELPQLWTASIMMLLTPARAVLPAGGFSRL